MIDRIGTWSPDQADAHYLASQIHQLAACTLVHLGYPDVAHLALREALALAGSGSDPCGPVRCSLSWLLLTQGRFTESHKLAHRDRGKHRPTGESSLPTWSLFGSLLLTGAPARGVTPARGRRAAERGRRGRRPHRGHATTTRRCSAPPGPDAGRGRGDRR